MLGLTLDTFGSTRVTPPPWKNTMSMSTQPVRSVKPASHLNQWRRFGIASGAMSFFSTW